MFVWAGAAITYGGYTNADATSWTLFTESGTVPTGATAVSLSIRYYDQTSFVAPEAQYIDELKFESPIGTSKLITNATLESWAGDITAPVGTFTPENGATGVLPTNDITISFDDYIRNTDNSTIDNANVEALLTLKETNASGADVAFTGTIDATNQIITINPNADLTGNQIYYVAIADVEDVNDNLTTGSNITFTTIDPLAPIISDVAISEVSPYYAGNDITVTWTSANIDFVKIEAWVPSMSAWTEMVASTDATDGSEIISIPVDAMYSTAYKVRVSYVTTPTVNAESANFTIIATPTINDIQSNTSDGDLSDYNGHIVKTSGIITFSGTGEYVIQDGDGSWNGIYVYDSNFDLTSVEGDSVTIQATVATYNGLTQLATVTSLTVNNSGNPLPAITTITTAELTEEYEGVYVKIINAQVTTAPASGKFTINDGSGALIVDDNLYENAEVGIVTGMDLTITGIGYYNNEFQVLPRYATDIVSATDTVGSTVYTVDQGALTITNMPFSTDLATFEGNITPAAGATWDVYDANGTDIATVLDDTKLLIVTAADGITSSTYTITRNAVRTGKAILTYSFIEQTGAAIIGDGTIDIEVTALTDRSDLVATFTISDGASIAIVAAPQESGVTHNDFTNPVTYTVTAEDATTKDWVVTVTNAVTASTEAEILTYSILGVDATIDGSTDNISVTLPYGTDPSALVATFTLSTGATAKVGVVDQESGVTANDFTNPVNFTVTAEDGTTFIDWTVTITIEEPNTDATVSSTEYNVNNTYNIINMVPEGTLLATFESNLTPATGATFVTYETDSITPATDLLDDYVVIVTAQDGITTNTYTIKLLVAGGASDLFFSEYIEGSSNNKALEIYNGTGADVDLANYVIRINGNGSAWTSLFDFPAGTIVANGDVYVIAHSAASAGILAVTDSIVTDPYGGGTSYVAVFNGDDVRGLFKVEGIDTTLIDIIGNYDLTDPGTAWTVAGIADATKDHTLVRKSTVTQGNTDWVASAGTTTEDSEWEVNAIDYIDNLGTHGAVTAVEAEILSFVLAEQNSAAVINSDLGTIDIEVLFGTDASDLIPTIEVSAGALIMPESGVSQDYTAPVVYTVTASDYMTTKDWTVTVTVNPTASAEAEILTFEIADMDSVEINVTDTIITVYMPYGTDASALTPTFTISAGAIVDIASDTEQDFTTPFTYTVTAQNGTNIMEWEVTVNIVEVQEVTIHDIQYTTATPANSLYDGQQIKTSGIVTAVRAGTTTSFYLQDGDGEWDAIYVYSSSFPVVLGDSVELVATVDEYNLLTELVSITSLTIKNSGNTVPDPIELTTLDVSNEAYESALVNVTGATCTSGSSGSFVVNDGSGDITIYKTLYADLALTINAVYDITGVITWFNSGSKFEILPRGASDVNTYPEISSVTINPTAPTTADAVVVTATLTDIETTAENMEGALYWGTAEGSEDTEVTFTQEGFTSVFSGTIPASTSSTIYYVIEAFDGILASEYNGSYSVITGINNPDGIVSMNIFPNPSNGQFTLEMNVQKAGTFKVEIVNISGQVVFEKQIVQDGLSKSAIDISNSAKGVYYIRINDGTSVNVQKIVIQ
ncbi:MAG: hypothetical protein A2041_03195 [Bacteroidetes bacterium GWA2_31_9b]|nr:MAG: hypothetical protein A2041_03195 [Bacteroidetes bacterium GWA2_31_9b]